VILSIFASPALAQGNAEMDAAEQSLRREMAPAGVSVERAAPNEIVVRMPSDITFDFNRADIRYEFYPRVRELARILNSHPSMYVAIIGHADAIGSDAYNQRLSERRAYSVGNALLDEGVRRRRIDARGMGESQPIASNYTDWGRAQNRRVEIRVLGDRRFEEPRFGDPRFE
ncbi:MAG: OmpA family protein, partial [Hyphomonadaceae bacterium]